MTVGLPTYNGAAFLEETLESLLAQDLSEFEIVISDNGSTDATEIIGRRAAASDPRVRFERSPENRGAAWNYNHLLAPARGQYFKWAADDDLCAPTFLRRCLEELERWPDAVVAWPQTTLIDEHGETMAAMDDANLELIDADPVARLAQLLHNREEWHPVFGLMPTDVLRRTRGIGAFVLADAALLAELALLGTFRQVREPLFLRRYHQGRSLMANPTPVAHAAWYDPAQATRRAVLPQTRLTRELLRRTATADLSTRDRLRASAMVLRHWTTPHWRHIGGELKMALRSSTP